ncbi:MULTISPECIES: single-stranded DNA-binding protein [unclassified Saccharothrix]|uniref:single-stranded DNA-binding protein n=1 Tax=unclassified Saccharothrix TaxID=2593673 RepID=UPI00307E3F08
MAYNETRVTITGVVASEVTRTVVGTGASRANFRMLTRERRWDLEWQAWVEGGHMFLSVTCWRDLADNVKASLANRDPVFVAGKLTIKELPDGGKYRQFVDVEAYAVGPDLTRCTVALTRPPDGPPPPPPKPEPAATTPDPPEPAIAAPEPAITPPEPAIAAPRKEGEVAPTRRKPRAPRTPPTPSTPDLGLELGEVEKVPF